MPHPSAVMASQYAHSQPQVLPKLLSRAKRPRNPQIRSRNAVLRGRGRSQREEGKNYCCASLRRRRRFCMRHDVVR
ncbi:unnamed protein product [Sphagnum troendelagicum]|uniref:Uncharacterized protein n=1 Tax=Sphagnum troendelagicum TaxID=128251 RepID=A0ABP0TTP5_9BRYO